MRENEGLREIKRFLVLSKITRRKMNSNHRTCNIVLNGFFFIPNEDQFDFRVPDREDKGTEHQAHQVESVRIMTLRQMSEIGDGIH
jgi:hypothetical protein